MGVDNRSVINPDGKVAKTLLNNRYKLPLGEQRKYLLEVEKISGLTGSDVAKILGVVGRSYRDWRREKFPITETAVEIIEKNYQIVFPSSKEEALDKWKKIKIEAARKGGLALLKKNGGPGTPEGRSKGGKRGIAALRARGLIPQPKPFYEPKEYSKELAEFVGILLGDGHIGKEQWSITLNSIVDKEYGVYVNALVEYLFRFTPGFHKRKNMSAFVISGSGSKAISYLQTLGLKIGNKVVQQVDVPEWIKKDLIFRYACVRGLVDTDGGVFIHKYQVNGKQYQYLKLCFVNKSIPLLQFVFETLENLKFHPKMMTKVENKRVWLYNQSEVKEYLRIIGTSNSRLQRYFNGGLPEW